MATRAKETLIALAGVGVVVAAVAAVLVVLGDIGQSPPAQSAPSATATTQPSPTQPTKRPPAPKLPPALVVKVDNVPAARPHTGLGSADAIYVEPVEAGFTRLLAVYWNRRPSVVGPVRSVRETDVELLQFLRRPVLAYSGAARRLFPILRAADLVHATPESVQRAFYRSGARAMPHNLYVNPRELPGTRRVDPPLRTGKAPARGRRVNSRRVEYRAASYDFRWSGGRWSVSMDGRPLTSTESGQLTANTVVIQRVRIVRGAGVKDPAGSPSPVARTVGSGRVTVLRGGRAYEGTWTRRSASRETTYRTTDGDLLPLARGPVWVLLVPA